MRARIALIVAAAFLASCASIATNGAAGGHGAPAPKGEIALGDYAKQSEAVLAGEFAATITARYPRGLAMSAASADLARNKFSCAAPAKAAGGDPPDQVCRRTVKAQGCDHTWQVHLFDDDAPAPGVARVRGLYDRACGADDLLGK